MSRYMFLCLLLFLTSALFSHARGDQNTIVLTDEVQLRLGDEFFNEGEYYRSITEYKKFIYLFPKSDRVPYSLLKIGMAHYLGKEYQGSIDYFSKVRATYTQDTFTTSAFFEGLSYEQLHQMDKAELAYDRALAFNTSGAYAADALIGKALVRVGEGDFLGGRRELDHFQSLYPNDKRFDAILKAVKMLDEKKLQQKKSPFLAGTLSAVLPGSGYIYAEHYRDGMVALLINALFITGTVVAIDQENYATAAIVGGLGLPFYLGNIYGGANAARNWNITLRRNIRESIAVTLDFKY